MVLKHINNTDVAMMVLDKKYQPSNDTYRIRCRWLNIVNPRNVFDLGIIDNVVIKRDDMSNWEPYAIQPTGERE